MKLTHSDAYKLLQKAIDEPLTTEESAQLQQYQESNDGKIYLTAHSHLAEDVPSNIPGFSMSNRELDKVATQINQQLQSKRRTRRMMMTARSFAMATAVFIILFLGVNWLVNRNYQPEPAAPMPPQPTVMPTAVLANGMAYVDVTAVTPETLDQLLPDSYNQTVNQVAADVPYQLFVPTQLKENLSFVGAMTHSANDVVEIAFRGSSKLLGGYRLWIFSQQPLTEFSKNEPLFPAQSNLNLKGEEAVETILTESQTIELNGVEALYEVREYVWPMSENRLVISVAWQENGCQYTLTILTPSEMKPDIVLDVAKGLHLVPFDP